MDKLVDLLPANRPIHSILLLVDATIVGLVKKNTEVRAVDEVMRPVINQDITLYHLFVVCNDNMVSLSRYQI